MGGFEGENYTAETLKNTKDKLELKGVMEGYSTNEIIHRATEDSDLTATELAEISAEIQYDVSHVCNRSRELCEELKDQIFISRLKNGIKLGVNGNGMILDEGLFSKHFNMDIIQVLENNNGGLLSRKTGRNGLEVGDTFTAVLEGEEITVFNGENEAEFKYNVNTQEISRNDLGENDESDDKSILDIDMEVDKVIEGGVQKYSGGTKEALLDPTIRKDFSKLSDQDIVTFSEEIGMSDRILKSLKSGEHIIAHATSDENLMKIAGLLSVDDPNALLEEYSFIKYTHTAPSILIAYNSDSVSLINENRVPYATLDRI